MTTLTARIENRAEGNVLRFYFEGFPVHPSTGFSYASANEILENAGLTYNERTHAIEAAAATLATPVIVAVPVCDCGAAGRDGTHDLICSLFDGLPLNRRRIS